MEETMSAEAECSDFSLNERKAILLSSSDTELGFLPHTTFLLPPPPKKKTNTQT